MCMCVWPQRDKILGRRGYGLELSGWFVGLWRGIIKIPETLGMWDGDIGIEVMGLFT